MKSRLTVCLCLVVVAALLPASCGEKKIETFEKKETVYDSEKQTTHLNWIGHWLDNYDRETLVREVAKEFTIRNPKIERIKTIDAHLAKGLRTDVENFTLLETIEHPTRGDRHGRPGEEKQRSVRYSHC